jgi:hypothetical protein
MKNYKKETIRSVVKILPAFVKYFHMQIQSHERAAANEPQESAKCVLHLCSITFSFCAGLRMKLQKRFMPFLVCKQTISTYPPPLVGEFGANFCG